jgi:hypothetical protein
MARPQSRVVKPGLGQFLFQIVRFQHAQLVERVFQVLHYSWRFYATAKLGLRPSVAKSRRLKRQQPLFMTHAGPFLLRHEEQVKAH